MKLVLFRHGACVPRSEWDGAEAERPLSAPGRKRTRACARGLARRIGEVDLVASSPWRRATESAALVAAACGKVPCVEIPALEPGRKPNELAQWLVDHDPGAALVVVGHGPELEETATWLLSGLGTPFLSLGRGGACVLDLPDAVAPGRGRLLECLRGGTLRRL